MKLEASDLDTNRMELEPRLLLCVNCMRGGGQCAETDRLAALCHTIEENPDVHITLVGAFDEVGARTGLFDTQTPAQRRKDLDVLQRLGLCFGDTRTARDLFCRISRRITTLEGICRYPANPCGKWPECALSGGEFYEKGNRPLRDAQEPGEMAARKARSCRALEEADRVVIRAHHLLCIVCFAGREDNGRPIPEDNLFEAWMKFRENPGIPVTLVEGPGACCVCPPCHSYHPARGVCVAACHLRDRKKDLDTFVALGLSPGDTLPARELYRRIMERIPEARAVCGYETDTSCEWTSCGGTDRYAQGLRHFKNFLE
ncbi:MAG: hypothetical protein FWC27_00435 [Firmicutes bacterium]|nr:hypothetical protein [Bacillota bacterium]